jgi:hypothetical protein
MAPPALPDQRAAGGARQFAQRAVELRGHLRRGHFRFTQRCDLQEQVARIDARMIVRQKVERHRGNLGQQFIERRRIGGGRDIVAMAAPHRGLVVPCGGNGEDHGFDMVAPLRGARPSRLRLLLTRRQ